MKPLWLLCVFSLLVSCRQELTPSQRAYSGFIEALNQGDSRKAWGFLSASTKERVRAKSKELAQASKGLVRDEPERLLFAGSRPPPAAKLKMTQVRADEKTAVLSVDDGGGSHEVTLVKDSGKWFVDFSERL